MAGKKLTHKVTGRTVTVTSEQAGFYTDNGWEEVRDGRSTGAGTSAPRKAAKAD